jgi:hypothetical protein
MKILRFALAATVLCARGSRVLLILGLLAPDTADVAGRRYEIFIRFRVAPGPSLTNNASRNV